MRIHIIQHLAHEHAACIIDWAERKNHIISYTRLFDERADFPPMGDFDMLIILGGTMGAYDEEKFPWLLSEKKFIRQAINEDKLVLGICLGSQILAEVLGGKVYRHDKKEIGFFPVYKTSEAEHESSLAGIPSIWMVFHWHGDTFDLPHGASHLFLSNGCRNQGFRRGKCFGLQFHGEINEVLLQSMIDHEKGELIKDDYVQTETEIHGYKVFEENIKYFNSFLDAITQLNLTRDAKNET